MISLFGKPGPSLLERLKSSVSKTRNELAARVEQILTGDRPVDPELLKQLETALLSADIGVRTTREVLAALRQQVNEHKLTETAALKQELKHQLMNILDAPAGDNGHRPDAPAAPPRVLFVVGVNGTGKTTTIGKLSNRLKKEGASVVLCAADTFRAAAIEQLEVWGRRAGVDVVKQKSGADPSAVVFDALSAARARSVDIVVVDTAGRLHTKSNLMAELDKMKRTAAKVIPGAPHDVLLVLDATTGQNGLIQAREFWSHAGVTGIVLTKLDGTAKGGIVVAIARELNLPIRFVGTGEQIDDLVPFDAQTYVNSLFDRAAGQIADEAWMARALALAARGVALAHPNPTVGAVLVKNGRVIGEGFHAYDRRDHAEIVALKKAGDKARGATLYVTLEPCCTTGRTGPCTNAVTDAGIKRVVSAMRNPNPAVAGRGLAQLRRAGIEVTTGIGEAEARRLNEGFAKWIRTGLPFVTLKVAATLDGRIAARAGRPTPITSAASLAEGHRMRHRADAILAGIGTVLADNPRMTDRTGEPRRRRLLRAIADSHLRTPLQSELVKSARHDAIVYTIQPHDSWKARALERAGVDVVRVPARRGRADLQAILRDLGNRQVLNLQVEAGAKLNGALLESGLADKLVLFYSPRIMGIQGVPLAETSARWFAEAPTLLSFDSRNSVRILRSKAT